MSKNICIERHRYETCINPHEILYRGCTDKCRYYADAPEKEDDDKIELGEPDKLNHPTLYGWICPRCGVVHSPFVLQCGCPPPTITSTGTTFENFNTEQQ
jgi:hypothetical protein